MVNHCRSTRNKSDALRQSPSTLNKESQDNVHSELPEYISNYILLHELKKKSSELGSYRLWEYRITQRNTTHLSKIDLEPRLPQRSPLKMLEFLYFIPQFLYGFTLALALFAISLLWDDLLEIFIFFVYLYLALALACVLCAIHPSLLLCVLALVACRYHGLGW
ncbi:hypothetical protein GGR53DRAFT_363358 [Hypoxylon sp. FL1150]|nr:hypothetical protein GGR53DRAFT_363358 [Hypoxylon sp. FL1150]